MRRPLVAANWKMHGRQARATELTQALLKDFGDKSGIDVLVCPPFVFLPQLQEAFTSSALLLGAQNLHHEAKGAFTGEISGMMLKTFGCSYVIVGHSERREQFAESSELVASKFRIAQEEGLTPILCVGETAEQREAGTTDAVILEQLQAVLSLSTIAAFNNAVVAYEPVWAIGTGLTASPTQAQEVHAMIRGELAKHNAECAAGVRIIYGGSVKADNAPALFAQPDIDGALVGGASLIVEDFLAICRAAQAN